MQQISNVKISNKSKIGSCYVTIFYWKNNLSHRGSDKPAKIIYCNGKLDMEKWYIGGKAHRENSPAIVSYDNSGKIIMEQYRKHGILHRNNGPAYRSPTIRGAEWFINGRNITGTVNEWLLERNIILSNKNNYEIPDDYKVEFRLLFQ